MPPKKATVTTARGKEYDTTAAASRPRRAGTVASAPAPKKAHAAKKTTTTADSSKKRGRLPKATASEEVADEAPAKKRRRPAASKPEPAVPDEETAPPKKRGRPPKGGETTKIGADDVAAAEQLEDELTTTAVAVDKAEEPAGKRQASVSDKKGKAAAKTKPAAADEPLDEETATGKRYWLMKAEQEDRFETLQSGREFNAKFTIDDLRSKSEPEPWDGVRNAVAAKNMRAMQKGDLAFFYASGGKSGRKPGITGVIEIVKEHEPDQTTHDKDSYGYVAEETARGKWCVVHVEFRRKLVKPVLLSELQKFAHANGVLSNMQVLNSARLSVSAVSEAEWNFITEQLIQGYEEEDNVATATDAAKTGDDQIDKPKTHMTDAEPSDADIAEALDKTLPAKSSSRTGSRASSAARGRSRTPKYPSTHEKLVNGHATGASAGMQTIEE